jgi:Tape measure protein
VGANKIYLQVDFQSDDADAQVKKLNQEIANVGTTSETASKKSSQAFKSVKVSVEETQRAVFGLGDAIASLAIVRLGADVIQSADKVNRLQISFEALMGSTMEAAQMMAAIRDVAAKSPFKFEEIADGARTLHSLGMEASRIPASMKAISATLAALGKGGDAIDRVARAIGNMYQKNEAGSREILRGGLLRENIPVIPMLQQALAPKYGKLDEQQIEELVNTHRLKGREIADALLQGMAERYEAGSGKVMSLLSVQLTKLTDEFQRLAVVVAGDVSPAVTGWIQQLQAAVKWLEQLSPQTRALIEDILKLALAVTALELAFKALGVVFSGGVIVTGIRAVGSAFAILGPAIAEVVAAGGGLSGIAGVFAVMAASPAAAGIMAVASAFGYLAIAMATWWAGGKALDWLEKFREAGSEIKLTPFGEWLTQSRHEEYLGQQWLAEAIPRALARNAELRAQLEKADPFVARAIPKLDASAAVDAVWAQNKEITDAIHAAAVKVNDDLIRVNEEALKKLDQMTADALERAKAHELGGLAAISHEYQKLYDQIEDFRHPFKRASETFTPELGVARLKAAEALDAQRVINEAVKKSSDERRVLEQKATQDRIADLKKSSELEVELAKQASDESMEARAEAQVRGYQILVANEEKIRAAMRSATAAQMDDALKAKQEELARQGFRAGTQAYDEELANVRTHFRQESEKQDLESYQRIGKYRIDIEKQVLLEAQQFNEQAFQMQGQNLLTRAQHMGDLLKAAVEVIPAQTEEEKTAQAQAAAQAEIAAANLVYRTQLDLNQFVYDDRKLSYEKLRDEGIITYAQYSTAITAMDRLQVQERLKLDQDRVFIVQKLDDEARKKHNEAVIADQKEVYDQIKSGVDKVWDAMTSRAGTFAQRIGNMLKAAFMDAAKSVVTTHISAALTEAFGKGHVGFGGGPLRQLLGKEPVFGKDKMQEAGHLGDVTTVSAGGYQTVPVTVMNPSPVQQQITQNVHVSSPEKAATMMSLPGLIGLGMAASAAASPSGIPSGAVAATSSAINGVSTGPEVFQQLGSVLGAPGGTAPFAGGGAGGGISGLPASVAKLSQLGKTLGIAGSGGGGTFNLMPGSMIPGLGLGAAVAGLMGARALGTHGPGGLAGGAALGAFSGLLGFGSLTAMFPALLAAGPVGWIAAAGIGAAVGLSSLFIKTADQKVRQKVKQVYGVDIAQKNIRMEIVQLAQQKYGGNLDVAIASPEVQEIVRMYAVATGANPSGMPRPMYSATIAESGAGGTQLQAVYQGGRIVANPYTGTTTAQFSSFATQAEDLGYPPNAGNLTAAGVIGTMAQSPGQVSAANAAALAGGYSRDATTAALIEPLTVMR